MSIASLVTLNQLPLIINLAPTGMVPTRDASQYVPIQPQEIIDDVLACAELGITMVHLHARCELGKPTYKKEIYQRIISGIREKCPDLIIGVSCSGRDYRELEYRSAVLELTGDDKPDMASLTLSSLNFAKQASVNEPQMIMSLAEKMLANDILPELEIFDLGMINYAAYLIEKLQLTKPLYANVMVGNIATAQPDLLSIATMTSLLPKQIIWSLGGIGQSHRVVTAMAATVAPGLRVGLEDNLWSDHAREVLTSNQLMVKRIHNIASVVERNVMPSSMLRTQLGLKSW